MLRSSVARRVVVSVAAAAVAVVLFASLAGATTTISSLSVVDAKETSDVIGARPSPGSVVKLRIVVNAGKDDRWQSTRWTVGSASQCQAADRDGRHTNDAFVSPNFTLPASGTITVRAETFTSSNCSGSPTSTDSSQITLGDVAPNGPLAEQCGRRIAMVLDESGSIGSTTGATKAVRDGAKAFVNSLRDGSTLAVLEFNTQARTVPLGGSLYNEITDTYASGVFATYIDGRGTTSSTRYNPADYSGNNVYTNWQDALLDTTGLGPLPELVIFVTDGDPTARNTATGQETGFPDGSYLAMDPAFRAANTLKSGATRPRILALGVGAAVTDPQSLLRIQAISGPNEFDGDTPLDEADYVLVENFDELQEALAQIAVSLCSVRVHVTKQVDELDGEGFQPENGWNFSGTASVSGATPNSYRWLEPGIAQGPPAANQTRTAATTTIRAIKGRLDFSWLPSPVSLTSQIVLTEAIPEGYAFVSAECVPAATPATSDGASASVTVSGLGVNQDATCTFRNRRTAGELTVVKVFEGTPVKLSLLIDDDVATTGSTQTFTTGPVAVRPGLHQVSEQFANPDQGALYESSYVCVSGGQPLTEGDGTAVEGGVDVADGGSVTCTFTNRKDLTGGIVKTPFPSVLPEPGGQVRFRVVVVNTSRGPATVQSLRDDVFGNLDASSPASQHSWIASSCEVGGVLAGFDGTPGGADTYRCVFAGRVTGTPTEPHEDTATVTLEDATGDTIDRSDPATVTFRDVLPAIEVTKTANPTYVQDSGVVEYTVVIANTSEVDPLLVDRLVDSVYGDLIAGPNRASCTYGGAAVELPFTLPIGQSISCTFRVTATETVTDTVTGSGTDDDGNRVSDADSAVVTVGITPPVVPVPPEPPVTPAGDPEVVLEVAKTAPETAFVGAGVSAFITDIRVMNTGGDPSPNTTLDDPGPDNSRFLAILAQPSQGSCAIRDGGESLHCDLGTLEPAHVVGVRVLVGVRGAAGTSVRNVATAACSASGPTECVAVAGATTRLVQGATPPCATVTVSPSALVFDGAAHVLRVGVRRAGAPVDGARVALLGAGVVRSVRTGANGQATATVRPTRSGVLRVRLLGQPRCPAQDVPIAPGVTG